MRVVNQVKDIDLDDGVSFEVKDVSNIMDEMEYPGIRVTMNANVGRLITPLKIDISTGDVITPRAIEFNYDLLLEDRSISLWSYNLETILAEKLQTVLARGILNTRMRDFYDIRMLLDTLPASMAVPLVFSLYADIAPWTDGENVFISIDAYCGYSFG